MLKCSKKVVARHVGKLWKMAIQFFACLCSLRKSYFEGRFGSQSPFFLIGCFFFFYFRHNNLLCTADTNSLPCKAHLIPPTPPWCHSCYTMSFMLHRTMPPMLHQCYTMPLMLHCHHATHATLCHSCYMPPMLHHATHATPCRSCYAMPLMLHHATNVTPCKKKFLTEIGALPLIAALRCLLSFKDHQCTIHSWN